MEELKKDVKIKLIDEQIALAQLRANIMQGKVDAGLANKEGARPYESLIADEIAKKNALISLRNDVEENG